MFSFLNSSDKKRREASSELFLKDNKFDELEMELEPPTSPLPISADKRNVDQYTPQERDVLYLFLNFRNYLR
jgi:hypothetical protein